MDSRHRFRCRCRGAAVVIWFVCNARVEQCVVRILLCRHFRWVCVDLPSINIRSSNVNSSENQHFFGGHRLLLFCCVKHSVVSIARSKWNLDKHESWKMNSAVRSCTRPTHKSAFVEAQKFSVCSVSGDDRSDAMHTDLHPYRIGGRARHN